MNKIFDPKADGFDEEYPSLSIAARMKRYGLESRLVINEEWAKVEEPEIDAVVVMSLSRAYSWWTKLCNGEVKSLAEIAALEGCTTNYVAKLMRGLLMAPDIVEGLVEGTQLAVKQKDLLRARPPPWALQRQDVELTSKN